MSCAMEGCERNDYRVGLCHAHYEAQKLPPDELRRLADRDDPRPRCDCDAVPPDPFVDVDYVDCDCDAVDLTGGCGGGEGGTTVSRDEMIAEVSALLLDLSRARVLELLRRLVNASL